MSESKEIVPEERNEEIMNDSKLNILRRWTETSYEERSLVSVSNYIHAKCRNANIDECIGDDAILLYDNICRHAKDKSISIRRYRMGLINECIFKCIFDVQKNESQKVIQS